MDQSRTLLNRDDDILDDDGGDNRYGWKKVRTTILCTLFLIGGFSDGVLGPSLGDLKSIYNCTYEQLGQAIMAKGIGSFFGSILGAFMVDQFRHRADLTISMLSVIRAVASCMVPWARYLPVLATLFAVQGISTTWAHVMTNTLCIAMWGERAATPVHLLHLGYTFSMTIAPIITAPFWSSNSTAANGSTFLQNNHFYAIIEAPFGHYQLENMEYRESRVWISFLMIGCIGVIQAVIFFILFLKGFHYEDTTRSGQATVSFRDLFHFNRTVAFHLYFLFSLFIIYIGNRARICVINLFLFSFAVQKPIGLSNYMGGLLMTTYSASMALARLLMAGLSKKIPMTVLMWTQSILILAVHILMLFYALEGTIQLWVLAALAGLFSGSAYPSLVSWADRYIEVRGYVMAVIDIGIGVGSFASTWVGGIMFDNDRNDIFYICIAGSGLVLLLLFPLQIIASIRGDRYKQQTIQVLVNEQDVEERIVD